VFILPRVAKALLDIFCCWNPFGSAPSYLQA